jgi:hypothetical protein
MIEVFRTTESETGDWVEAELRAMVVGYRKVLVTPETAKETLGQSVELPVIRENGTLVSGRSDLLKYLRQMEQFAESWRKFQGDYCYIDDDGDVC